MVKCTQCVIIIQVSDPKLLNGSVLIIHFLYKLTTDQNHLLQQIHFYSRHRRLKSSGTRVQHLTQGAEQRPPPPRWQQSRVPLWQRRWKLRAVVANLCWQHVSESNAQWGRTLPSCAGPSADCKLGPVTCLSSMNFADDSFSSFSCFMNVKGKSTVENKKGRHSATNPQIHPANHRICTNNHKAF